MPKNTLKPISFPLALILAVGLYFLWMALYSSTPIGFRGMSVTNKIQIPFDSGHFYISQASWSKDLPIAFRPMVGWLVCGFYSFIVQPLLQFFQPDLIDTDFPFRLSSTFILGSAYIFAFIFLVRRFPPFYGLLALLSFGLLPFYLPIVGISTFDPLVLFLWGGIMTFLFPAKEEPTFPFLKYDGSKKSERRLLIGVALFAIFISWTMENTGVAFSIALFILALARPLHKDPRPFWKMWLVSTIATLSSLGISWLMTHRHPDVYWNFQDHSLGDMWEVYGRHYSFGKLWDNLYTLTKVPLTAAMIGFLVSLFLGKNRTRPNREQGRAIVWCSLSCLIGFFCTVCAGRYMVGMVYEWTRQLMPFAFLITFGIYGATMIVTDVLIEDKNK